MTRATWLWTLCLLLVSVTRVDAGEEDGLELLRLARRALAMDSPDAAQLCLDAARTELPFSSHRALLQHLQADVLTRRAELYESGALTPPLGALPDDAPPDAQPTQMDPAAAALADRQAALEAYQRALIGGEAGSRARVAYDQRARINSGVLQHQLAEQVLSAAGVPLSPEAIPVDADPAPLKAAITSQLPVLEQARSQFLQALGQRDDGGSRESIQALTRRLDVLHEMLEILDQMEQDQQQDDEQQDEDQEQDGEDGEDGDSDENDQKKEPDDEDGQGDPSEDEQDSEPQQPPPDGEQQQPPEPTEMPALTAAQMADLLEQLQDLEERALQMDRQRRAGQHESVEKDW